MPEPGEIVRRLEPALGPAAGEPVALDGGITNRNFRVRFGDRDCVLRLTGRDTALLGIDRDAERLASDRAARRGIGPAVVTAGGGGLGTEFPAVGPIDAAG